MLFVLQLGIHELETGLQWIAIGKTDKPCQIIAIASSIMKPAEMRHIAD